MDLFQDDEHGVPGLRYRPDLVTPDEERELLAAVDGAPWSETLKRRVQHYGYRYDYKARAVDREMYLGPLPDWARPTIARMLAKELMPAPPDQLIVNEYLPGQGISAHVDCIPCFGPVITALSLGSACVMEFTPPVEASDDAAKIELVLRPRSLLILQDQARYQWRHAIRARRSDTWDGERHPRSRRVSLTFRKTRLDSR